MIADFQGRELDDERVVAEYKEIRDAVLLDVSKHRRKGNKADKVESGRGSIIPCLMEKI